MQAVNDNRPRVRMLKFRDSVIAHFDNPDDAERLSIFFGYQWQGRLVSGQYPGTHNIQAIRRLGTMDYCFSSGYCDFDNESPQNY